ncbi:Pyruvate/2-oxoglutarate dehydrogenase complex, dihydrolipoamide dehydrogenase (E3) component [Chitinophaga sp. YR573]|uniref:mercuric reductase n=1 Tax=Chitinophaga sp. YR573 TaxID=1881040 RepID=UPI0008BE5CA5|nr:mercuric reductase [Chitinophaga sp. YR573]SEW43482.1 Pyruvate/2-oxoglutarate dehydrogenase complex, dihydrolipoamide dehydrogenase (E3) component [Chitinophaga sp. YR573]
MKKFDAIVIGSGQGGTPLAKKLAKAGWKTVLVEKRFIGGTCVNDGCTPTKSMVACAKAAYTISHSQEWGITVSDCKVNLEKIIERKNQVVNSFRSGAERGLQKTEGLTILYGEAVFTGDKTLSVKLNDGSQEEISADYVLINTGTLPKIPNITGIDTIPYLTNTTLLDNKTLPSHLLILGGSYIALEFGQMFRRFGSQVTIIETKPQLLSREDEDVAVEVRKIMETDGITVHTSANVKKIEQAGNDVIRMELTSGGQSHILTGSHLLVATGREPQTKALQLDKTGVKADDRGYIKVNDKLETGVPGIYAFGDVKGGPAFTHIAYNDHLILLKILVDKKEASIKDRPVPYCMFTDPQLGRIGLTEKEASDKGLNIKVACLGMERVARAIETGHTQGFMKAIVDADTNKILGAAILCEEGGEVMSVLQMAIIAGFTATQLKEMVFAHPLYTESLNNLFATIAD